jgi:hypothetical protein
MLKKIKKMKNKWENHYVFRYSHKISLIKLSLSSQDFSDFKSKLIGFSVIFDERLNYEIWNPKLNQLLGPWTNFSTLELNNSGNDWSAKELLGWFFVWTKFGKSNEAWETLNFF